MYRIYDAYSDDHNGEIHQASDSDDEGSHSSEYEGDEFLNY